jgi:hypothetical protein
MKSNIKAILEFIILEKAQGNTFNELNIKMKIMMKGIHVKNILEGNLQDDSGILMQKLINIADEFNVDLNKM